MRTRLTHTTALFLAATASIAVPAAPAAALQPGLLGTALLMRQLDGVKRVLMIAAHPDDEDTSLLATLARGMGAETAYLSLSRGEGGQNFIGPRLHEGLGVIRTGELVAARALDGGEQYFTRAFDFGYSKTLDETLEFWPLEEVLRDVVFVVRKFRPHVIVSVFSGTRRDGHGQHQLAGVAATEAFAAAGDPDRFPELAAAGVTPWAPSKLYRSVRFYPGEATLSIPSGDFDPVLGRSHFQLAMESRSRHRSQEMGSGQAMGPRTSSLRLEASVVDGIEDGGIFAGVDTTLFGQLGPPLPAGWPADTEERLAGYRRALAAAERGLSGARPDGAVAGLVEAARILRGLLAESPDGEGKHVLEGRLAQVSEAVLAAAGVVTEVRVGRDLLTPGESVVVDVTVWNGGRAGLTGVDPALLLPAGWEASRTEESAQASSRSRFFRAPTVGTPADGRIAAGEVGRWSWRVTVPPDARPSAPYYLAEERDGAMYEWPDYAGLWALPFDPAPVRAGIALEVDGVAMRVERDGEFIGVDRGIGEYRRAVLVAPAIDVAVDPPWMVWPSGARAAREIGVVLTNTSATARSGSLRLEVADGWSVEPASVSFALEPDGANGSFVFMVTPPRDRFEGESVIRAVASSVSEPSGGPETARDRFPDRFEVESVTETDIIDYPHIPRAMMVREAAVRISVVPVTADTGLSVGYIMGSGDDGAAVLRQIGMEVDELGPQVVRAGDFADYDVLVLGIRAYETRPDLVAANEAVLDFARGGGTVIVQYNKYEFPAGGFAPYPVTINRPHDRVTDETAPVTLLAPESPVFAGPNRIGDADFEGWVQERGLYFLGDWDEQYTAVMEMADPGEEPKRGGLLVARVGEGLYVYTGLAFFRQFPAGVAGAYRLFANLVSLRAGEWGPGVS
ncbi:MAG: PIG-L family deacetylase [Gemmatimonadota bacterium]|nr:PIG-L family deacetylase [Gemmatimonadota bacterium]